MVNENHSLPYKLKSSKFWYPVYTLIYRSGEIIQNIVILRFFFRDTKKKRKVLYQLKSSKFWYPVYTLIYRSEEIIQNIDILRSFSGTQRRREKWRLQWIDFLHRCGKNHHIQMDMGTNPHIQINMVIATTLGPAVLCNLTILTTGSW